MPAFRGISVSRTPTNGFPEPSTYPPPHLSLLTCSNPANPLPSPITCCLQALSTPMARLPWAYHVYTMKWRWVPRRMLQSHGISTTLRICVPRLTIPSSKIFPSTHFQTIPRPLRIPLSLILPEHVPTASTAGSDLDMTLCVFLHFLGFRWVVGAKS